MGVRRTLAAWGKTDRGKWAHDQCGGVDSDVDGDYVCFAVDSSHFTKIK